MAGSDHQMPDLYISYSPSDTVFVAELSRKLSERNLPCTS
jgi:hypothetical protein